jgi:hypothetical protein
MAVHGHFPTGGWTHVWVGDPNRGYGKKQPGGWCFNLLPYVEQTALHDLAKSPSEAESRKLLAKMFETPVTLYTCPSRRSARPWPFIRASSMVNIDPAEYAGRSDYAANIGNLEPTDQRARGPASLEEGDEWVSGEDREKEWIATHHNGVIFQRSIVAAKDVSDGLSNTYLIGEKFLDPEHYEDGWSNGDDHSLYVGFDRDNARSGNKLHPPMRDKKVPLVWLAYGDDELVTDWNFGSAHPTGIHMLHCDGSVHRVDYSIDIDVHSALSSRSEGEVQSTR